MIKQYIHWMVLTILILCTGRNSQAQAPRNYHAGEIQLALKKLTVLGSVLYIAAHPDDENTAMLAYLANDRLVRTAYLSLTRGDGGQNLIGPEQRELMGLIRTQELLQARRIDKAQQFFTRANDFGYSKNAKEAKKIWGKEEVLHDIVWTIRKFRPDVIITRFPPTRNAGHGHHEASALLGIEAFSLAADPKAYPEQLKYVKPWQAKRIVWNCYSRRFGRFSNLPPDSSTNVPQDIGSYNPLLGKSHPVIAAESRSMHKSQGFGASKPRGARTDYLLHLAGTDAREDVMDDVDITWKRVQGGEAISQLLEKAYAAFHPEKPSDIVPTLLQARALIQKYQGNDEETKYWLNIKKDEVEEVIGACMGLWLEANGREFAVSAGDSLKIRIEALNRSALNVSLESVVIQNQKTKQIGSIDTLPEPLHNNQLFDSDIALVVPMGESITQPYWLRKDPKKGLFQVDELTLIGTPENKPALEAIFQLKINNEFISYTRPVTYKWRKPDEGELYRNLEITPPVMLTLEDKIFMFTNQDPKAIRLKLEAGKDDVLGSIRPELPEGWKIEPQTQNFEIAQKGAVKEIAFTITPPATGSEVKFKIWIKMKGESQEYLGRGIQRIDYLHIPIQTVFPITEAKLNRLDVKITGKNLAYIQGAGDDIPQSLKQIGYQVNLLDEKKIQEDLTKYDAIIVGVRAYNTQNWLKYNHEKLLDYVKNGGTLLTQYHTPFRLVVDNLGPYPFKISRDRVTVEEAPVKFLKENHPLLNYPNKITDKDFEGWVQERGLYFSNEWDEKYQTVLSSNDPGEKELSGGLLYTSYGDGTFIYTGYSFFRELPAGVPGAYRFFVNLISQ